MRTQRLILRSLKTSDYPNWYDCWVNRLKSQNEWDFLAAESIIINRYIVANDK